VADNGSPILPRRTYSGTDDSKEQAMNSRREYLYQVSWWYEMTIHPISLHRLAKVDMIPGVFIKPDWLIQAQQREADAKDERETVEDARYG
jgi:hypothetical protein